MADKSRSIQTKFWYDTWVETLSISEKLLYLYFLTNPLTNLLGIYEISLKRISDESGIAKETIRKALERFESNSRIIYTDNFIIITKFLKNQKLNPNMQLNVEHLFEGLPNFLKDKILDNGSKGFESIRNGLLKLKGKEKGKEKGKLKEESESETKSAISKFVKPTKEQIQDHCNEKRYKTIDVDYWLNYYNSNGWKVGKNPMRDWQSTISNWEKRNLKDKPTTKTQKRISHYVYKCPSCENITVEREFRKEITWNHYTCKVEGCTKTQLVNKEMIGSNLIYIEKVYKEES